MMFSSITGRQKLYEPLLIEYISEVVGRTVVITYKLASCAGASALTLALRKQAIVTFVVLNPPQLAFSA